MAPVPRCDLRLPCTPKPKGAKSADDKTMDEGVGAVGAKAKSSDPNAARRTRVDSSSSAKAKSSDAPTVDGGSGSGSSGGGGGGGGGGRSKFSDSGAASKSKKGDDPTGAGSYLVTAKYKRSIEPDTTRSLERTHKSQEFADEQGIDADAATPVPTIDPDKIPESAHGEVTRDSAEIIEKDSEFRTSLTRDSYEAEQHAGHVIGDRDLCELLRKCKEEVEAAIEAGECEIMQCPSLDRIGTPGDVCAQFCPDRLDSPKSVAQLQLSSKKSKYCAKWSKKKERFECDMRLGPNRRAKAEVVCKGTYKSDEVYTSLWGSSKAVDFRKRLESQMKKKRNLLEKMHRKEFLRRQKMRRRAKEKRRALKQRDPSKISTNGDDNLRINKAYDLRVNYNKQLPTMPGTMQQHFDKFKKPPFNTYVTGQKVCTKRVDEFEKLRVPEKEKKS